MPESAKDHAIADIDKALSAKALQHRIAHTLPLDQSVESNELVEQGNIRGAVVLGID
jgi:NADPH:quinone reductase-like Zn-dependent oxidoreductase